MKISKNKNLRDYNTYKLNSVCKTFIEVDSEDELLKVVSNMKEPYKIIGNGSNLILPEYIKGTIIYLNLKDINISGEKVNVGAGVFLPKLVKECVSNGLSGLEWASLIPASLGGAIVNNVGAYKHSIMEYVTKVRVLDNGKIKEIDKDEIDVFYHKTSLSKSNVIVLGATLKLVFGDKDASLELIKDYTLKRSNSQPVSYPSAGSVFRNPDGDYAGKIIDEAGLKNCHVGDAYVSDKHANFIVNKGNASSSDVISLIKIIKEKCEKEYNIKLELEQEIVHENLDCR